MPNSKGWFKEFIERRKKRYQSEAVHVSRHHDMSLYNLLQPTGLMYGTPVRKKETKLSTPDEQDKIEQLLVESLTNSLLVFRESKTQTEKEFQDVIDEIPWLIQSFYSELFPEYAVSSSSLFGKKKDVFEVCEKIIHNRIHNRPGNNLNFWTHLFYNSLIFLDIYLFTQWINLKSEKIVTDFFREEKEELRLTIIKIIAGAALANNIVEMAERRMFEVLLKCAQLSKERERKALSFFSDGVLMEEIDLPQNNSWLLKKFFLEMAILMVWADREIDENEWKFLQRFAEHLGFFSDDLEKSMIAIEGFLLSNWKEIELPSENHSPNSMHASYMKKISFLAMRNESKILSQISQSEPLVRLIDRYHSGISTEDENMRLRNLLRSILQELPSLTSVTLPNSLFTLTTLFEILPESISAKA